MENVKVPNHTLLSHPVEQKLTIGNLAKAVERKTGVGCTPAMILNYERLGLLSTPMRSKGGLRLFSPDMVGRVVQIKRMQEEGLALAEIKWRLETREEKVEIDPEELPVDRRAQILNAASTVFPQFGFSETTIQTIAQEAGVSSSTIYQYFLSKEDLFQALIQRISFLDLLQHFTSALEQQDANELKEQEQIRLDLIDLAEAFLDTHHANAEMVRLIITESYRFPELGIRYIQELILPIERLLEEYFHKRFYRKNVDRDWLMISIHAFFGMFLNFVLVEDLLHGKETLGLSDEDLPSRLVDLFLFGFLNHPI